MREKSELEFARAKYNGYLRIYVVGTFLSYSPKKKKHSKMTYFINFFLFTQVSTVFIVVIIHYMC